jgi:hypothetical protein
VSEVVKLLKRQRQLMRATLSAAGKPERLAVLRRGNKLEEAEPAAVTVTGCCSVWGQQQQQQQQHHPHQQRQSTHDFMLKLHVQCALQQPHNSARITPLLPLRRVQVHER